MSAYTDEYIEDLENFKRGYFKQQALISTMMKQAEDAKEREVALEGTLAEVRYLIKANLIEMFNGLFTLDISDFGATRLNQLLSDTRKPLAVVNGYVSKDFADKPWVAEAGLPSVYLNVNPYTGENLKAEYVAVVVLGEGE